MAIELTTPIVEPAQPEKTFDKVWVTELSIRSGAKTTDPIRAVIVRRPYRTYEQGGQTLGELGPDSLRVIRVPDLDAVARTRAAAGKTALALAMAAVYAAIEELGREVDATPGSTPVAIGSE